METPQLIASDMDGTLLTPAETVTPRTVAAITRVVRSETPFVLVTGRPPRWIPVVAQAVGLTGYAVCANGAVLYDIGADRVQRAYTLTPALLHAVAHEVDTAIPGAKIAVERVGDSAFALNGREFLIEDGYRHPWIGDPTTVVSRTELLATPAVRLLVRQAAMTSDAMVTALQPFVSDAVNITFSSNDGILEICPPNVNKGTGLAEVAGQLGIAAVDTVAFGDMPNDVPMLRWAGHGVAMANAHPDVLAIADEVTAANTEDGVAQVLERWF